MFTIEQIKAAHAKVKSGADFPQYIRDLKQLGVAAYETRVSDGSTTYRDGNHQTQDSGPKYAALTIASNADGNQFRNYLQQHQQGQTDYPTFCTHCAQTGIDNWVVDLQAMTCTYFDKAGNNILEEQVPA